MTWGRFEACVVGRVRDLTDPRSLLVVVRRPAFRYGHFRGHRDSHGESGPEREHHLPSAGTRAVRQRRRGRCHLRPWSPPAHGTTRAARPNDVTVRLEFPDGSTTTTVTPGASLEYRIRVSGVHDQTDTGTHPYLLLAKPRLTYRNDGGSRYSSSR